MPTSTIKCHDSLDAIGEGGMRRSFYVLGVLVALAVAASGARGQNVNASLSGTITDSSGAVVAGATVTATNEGTQLSRTAVSDARGIYVLNVLPVGNYTLSVSLTGFKETVIHNIVLQVDQQARKDVTLQAGSLAQTVTVEGTAPIVQAESSSMGEVVNNQEVTELPLNGRNLDQLALISGGVVPANQSNVEAGSASTVQTFSVAGGRSNTNAFLIDGVANTDDAIDNSALHPSLEMVQEFRIETNDYSAQFGQYSGGQVNITTKSGTNQFHGSAFEFLRNDALDAKKFLRSAGAGKAAASTQSVRREPGRTDQEE